MTLVICWLVDLAVASLQVIGMEMTRIFRALRLVRLVRILRIFRIARVISDFRKMVFALQSSVKTLTCSIVLLVFEIYLLCNLFRTGCQQLQKR